MEKMWFFQAINAVVNSILEGYFQKPHFGCTNLNTPKQTKITMAI